MLKDHLLEMLFCYLSNDFAKRQPYRLISSLKVEHVPRKFLFGSFTEDALKKIVGPVKKLQTRDIACLSYKLSNEMTGESLFTHFTNINGVIDRKGEDMALQLAKIDLICENVPHPIKISIKGTSKRSLLINAKNRITSLLGLLQEEVVMQENKMRLEYRRGTKNYGDLKPIMATIQ
jgi:hypothetical protein